MPPERLHVALGSDGYPIHFDREAIAELREWIATIRDSGRALKAITDEAVAAAQSDLLERAGFAPEERIEVPSGESTKRMDAYQRVLRALAKDGAGRDAVIFAVGGGVVGDLAGFVAATYLRGVALCQIPTTLLAMVDSSVGGKTGINLPEGKNLVGAFLQPKAVFIVSDTLETLPDREFAAGMAEVVKYGMLGDAALFAELEEASPLAPESERLSPIVRRCCALKAAIVEADERETAARGGRALLNLGHTFAHAIETVAGYGDYLHGEAVAVGLVLAARLAESEGGLTPDDVLRVERVLGKYGLPIRLKNPLPVDELMAAMRKDKKTRARRLRFISMRSIGDAVTRDDVDPEFIATLWSSAMPA